MTKTRYFAISLLELSSSSRSATLKLEVNNVFYAYTSQGQLTGNLWSSLASHSRLLASREGFLQEVARMLKAEAMKYSPRRIYI